MSTTTYLLQRDSGGVVVSQGETPDDALANTPADVSVTHPFGVPFPVDELGEKIAESDTDSVVLW